MYGSSYRRALVVLATLLLAFFPALYGFMGLRLPFPQTPTAPEFHWHDAPWPPLPPPAVETRYPVISWSHARKLGMQDHALATELSYVFWKGIVHSVEVVTFQRSPALEPAGDGSRIVAAFEIVAVPGQLALLLLALRRRFRR